MKTVVALFDNLTDAEEAVNDLVRDGYDRQAISLVAGNEGGRYGLTTTYPEGEGLAAEGTAVAEGAVAGGVTGAALGGLAGVLLGLGALAIPGIGPVIAAGPVIAGLTGASIGAAAGGLLGALAGWGIPEEAASVYTEGVRRGGTMVAVTVGEAWASDVVDILERRGPVDVAEGMREEDQVTGWQGDQVMGAAETPPDRWTTADVAEARDTTGDRGWTAGEETSFVFVDDPFDDYKLAFHNHYDETFDGRGRPFAWYEPGYRYGYMLATDERFADYETWDDLENEARAEWDNWEHPADRVWDEIGAAARHAWEAVRG